MRNTVDIMGVHVDAVTMEQAVAQVHSFIEGPRACSIYTPNAEIMMAAHRSPELKDILNRADMVIADGAGVVLASKILKKPLPEKVSGIDLVRNLFSTPYSRQIRVFLFGSKPGVAEEARDAIHRQYPSIEVVGCRNGYFNSDEEMEIVAQVNASEADVLLVALGAPKQEKWIFTHLPQLDAKVCIGVGGTLDVLSGRVQLAPDFYRRHGLEWLYRLIRQPSRFKRMLDIPRFMIRVFWARLFGRRK